MLQSRESETEILLGNKQLLGVFFVAVILLGVAFAGGYKVGQSAGKKSAIASVAVAPDEPAPAPSSASTGGETHAFPAAGSPGPDVPSTSRNNSAEQTRTPDSGVYQPPSGEDAGPPLGAPKHGAAGKGRVVAAQPAAVAPDRSSIANFSPMSGQTFLQVVAVGRDEAEGIADVLRKKGFRAHAVPKPGATKLYRVIIGPIRDAGDLSSTRDSLRRTGFREIFVQRY